MRSIRAIDYDVIMSRHASATSHLTNFCTTIKTSCSAFLPPANEVWDKVICLHLSVILSTGGVPAPGGCLVPAGCLVPGECLVLGGVCSQGVPGGDPIPRRLLLRAVRILLECILVSQLNTSALNLRDHVHVAYSKMTANCCFVLCCLYNFRHV